jgi:hypothetical protein
MISPSRTGRRIPFRFLQVPRRPRDVATQAPRRLETTEGLSQLFAGNVLAPYVLTAGTLTGSGSASLEKVKRDYERVSHRGPQRKEEEQ